MERGRERATFSRTPAPCEGGKVSLASSDQTLPSLIVHPPTSTPLYTHTHTHTHTYAHIHTNCSQPAPSCKYEPSLLVHWQTQDEFPAVCPHSPSASQSALNLLLAYIIQQNYIRFFFCFLLCFLVLKYTYVFKAALNKIIIK